MKRIRKAMAFVFALVICLSMLPATAFAEGGNGTRNEEDAAEASLRSTMLTFDAAESFLLMTQSHTKGWNGTLEYSADAQTWTVWDGAATLSSGLHNGRQRLYLRGTGNSRIVGNDFTRRWVLIGSEIACLGNIENLLDYQTVAAGEHPEMAADCYKWMFSLCTALTTAPELPATALAERCYSGMFYGCTSLTTPPALPATDLPDACYMNMFTGCSGIRLSAVQTDEYNVPYCIPSAGHSNVVAPNALNFMFSHTGGPFAGTPQADRVYYLPGPGNQQDDGMLTFSSKMPFTLETANHLKNWNITGTLEYSTDAQTWTVWDGAETLSSGAHEGEERLYLRGTGNDRITGYSYEATNKRWVLTGSEIACSGSIENLLDYQAVAAGNHPLMEENCFAYLFYGCEALIAAPELSAPTLTKECYSAMFQNCTSLTAAPVLSATTLADYCYWHMFENCTSLTVAPDLPVMMVKSWCYADMFKNCTSLTDAPALPSLAVAYMSYDGMFQGCTSLTAAPELPATSLADSCYRRMFSGCTSLAAAPELPATTLIHGCYCGMFEDCVNLTTAPELPAMTLEPFCYEAMFKGCTALSSVPELPATTLANGCYQNMFWGCTSLTTPPALPATDLPYACYVSMFSACSGIRLSQIQTDEYSVPYKIPSVEHSQNVVPGALNFMFWGTGGPFAGTPETDRVYYLPGNGIQPGDNVLTFSSEAPFTLETANGVDNWNGTLFYSTDTVFWTEWDGAATLSSGTHEGQERLYLCGTGNKIIAGEEDYRWVLTGGKITCSGNVETLLDYETVAAGEHPEMGDWCFACLFDGCEALIGAPALPAVTMKEGCYSGMFKGCVNLTTAPELPATALASKCYAAMFSATGISSAPALPATALEKGCYAEMFEGCSALTDAPALPATTLAAYCYNEMFRGCTSLTAAPALPAPAMARYCYGGMFADCTSLTLAPALPSMRLQEGCYQEMFLRCTSLDKVPELPAKRLAPSCYRGMFSGCTSLTASPALPAGRLADHCYDSMYKDCISLATAPVLPAKKVEPYCYAGMFSGCTSLEMAPRLRALNTEPHCYEKMFYRCEALRQVPALRVTVLEDYCYCRMFYGCGSIRLSAVQAGGYIRPYSIPALQNAEYVAENALTDMFGYTGGPFTGPIEADTTYYLHNSNSIVW